jgi:membrane protein required for colicin V production
MPDGPNNLDFIFASVLLIFVAIAFFRGFVKEIFSLLNWAIAYIISYFLAPILIKLLSSYWGNLANVERAFRGMVFAFSFIVAIMLTSSTSKTLQELMPKAFDRLFGVLFGVIKTLIVFGFVYSLTLNAYQFKLGKKIDSDSPLLPKWFKDAKCHDLITSSARSFHPFVEKFFDESFQKDNPLTPEQEALKKKIDKILLNKKEFSDADLDKFEKIMGKDFGFSSLKEGSDGLNKEDMDKMNRLLDAMDK